MGIFLQNSLFPFQESLNRMGTKMGVGSRMPGWAKKAAMSSFQPVPIPEKDKGKKKSRKKKEKNPSGNKRGKSAGAAAEDETANVQEAGTIAGDGNVQEAGTMAGDGNAQEAGTAAGGGSVSEAAGMRHTQIGRTQAEQQAGPEKSGSLQNLRRPGLPGSPEDLRTAVVWSEILGEPAAWRRKRRRAGQPAAGGSAAQTDREAIHSPGSRRR